MKKFLKWVGIILGSLLVIAAVAVFVLVNRLNGRMEKNYSIVVEKITIPSDSASLERGKSWTAICQSCHGEALQGKVFFEDPKIGKIYSPNLTPGEGGVGKTYKDEDWIRSIRHGVRPSGKPLFVMPSADFQNMSEKDLSCLIGYLKKLPPVDNIKGENIIPVFTKILMQLGAFGDVFNAEIIKHDNPFPAEIPESDAKEYGNYMCKIVGCVTCHTTNYAGGKSPDPNSPLVPNITVGGNLGNWTSDQFIKTMRTGVTPENKTMQDEFMPWKHIGQMNDTRLTAIFNFLKSLPKAENPKS